MLGLWGLWRVAWAVGSTPADPAMQCEVRVLGVPHSMLAHHHLEVGERVMPARASVLVERPAATVHVRLRGPRYEAHGELDPSGCDHVFELAGRPRPAVLELRGTPADATVECAGCPGMPDHEIMFVDRMPPMPIEAPSIRVKLVIRAPRFARLELPLWLVPGSNVVHVRLEPLPPVFPRPPLP